MNPEVCVLWVASDVLMCSASIWHMCTMSMDRYFTLKYPMRYGRNKTRSMVAGKILFVWVVSMAISSPICIHGFIDTSIVFNDGICVPRLKNFIIYGSIFAFYIPLCIMIVTYVLTIRILWKNQKRMSHIDRSDLKPRLAQLTAQCTGFAIPKLLSNLRRANRSPSPSHTSLTRTRGERRPLAPYTGHSGGTGRRGNINATVSESDLRDEGGGRDAVGRGSHVGMAYLAPPSPQTCTRSPSPASTNLVLNSDTDDSESEPNYFRLLQSSQSYRSLCTPISLTTSEKSLHRRLQKKQLYQQQQQELQLLRQEYHQQRQIHRCRQDAPSLTPSPPEDHSHNSAVDSAACSTSVPTSPSPPLSPLFDEDPQHQQVQPLLAVNDNNNSLPLQPLSSSQSTPKLPGKASNKKDLSPTRKVSKRKRYSKRSKKRRNSLTQQKPHSSHLEVPSQVFSRRGRNGKQMNAQPVLSTAVSDTQVSQAGRKMTSNEEAGEGVSSFHLSYSNLNKDYKSLEWDRRYFQIQEEMDKCLMGDFGRWDRRHSRPDSDDDDLPQSRQKSSCIDQEQKTLLKPEISLPSTFGDPLNVQTNFASAYSRSAPNSPLNRRNPSLPSDSSSDDEADDVDNEETSDKNNDDGNDTSGSSNADVVTIRLHPPTPKIKSHSSVNISVYCSDKSNNKNVDININNADSNNSDNNNSHAESFTAINISEPNNDKLRSPAEDNPRNRPVPSLNLMNGLSHMNNHQHTIPPSLINNGSSLHSLSPVTSPLPELVISSEGEMTLEETDDTLDDSPKHQRIKLRRPHSSPCHTKHRFRKKQMPQRNSSPLDKSVKLKRSSFRNTFRIHRGKGPVKHILSKKTASNERKASKVLGIIFLVFVTLWTPFFTVNILSATCASCIANITPEMMSLFLWMGYIASLANPIIYTMFNTAFRRTFIRILTCKIQRTCRTKASDAHYMSYTTMLASERRNTVTVVLRDESR